MSSVSDWPERAHRELVVRIVKSKTFARSERLSTLLSYVCDMTLKGRADELNEQKIGSAVFGRAIDYDSSIDGIVRTQASRLRQRLGLYFEEEGAEEPVRILIPKGGYIPLFEARPAREELASERLHPAAGPPSMQTSPAVDIRTDRSRAAWILCAILALAVVGLSLRPFFKDRSARTTTQSHPLWGHIFSSGHTTLEVPGDSGLVLFHRFSDRSVPVNDYLAGDYRNPKAISPEYRVPEEEKSLSSDFAGRRYTSIVDLDAAVTLAQIAQSFHSQLQVRYARDLRPNDLKSGNVILVGAFEANPWVELFERNLNFALENNYRSHTFKVLNKSPRAGEPTHWNAVAGDPLRKAYGVVAYMPNLSGNGNALLIEGTTMAGTEAAWDFVSDDSELLPFLKRIQLPDGETPHFELLLGTQSTGSSAGRSNLISWRVTDNHR